MSSKQKGATLVELIAALAIVGAIVAIAWTALSIGLKHGAIETSQTQLQQTSNLVITKLINEHRGSDYYYLRYEDDQLELKACTIEEGCENFYPIDENDYDYSGTINGISFDNWDETTVIEPQKYHVELVLTLTDPNNIKNKVTTETSLTRILTN